MFFPYCYILSTFITLCYTIVFVAKDTIKCNCVSSLVVDIALGHRSLDCMCLYVCVYVNSSYVKFVLGSCYAVAVHMNTSI